MCERIVREKNAEFHYPRFVSPITPGDHMHEQPDGPPAQPGSGTPEGPGRDRQERHGDGRPGRRLVARPLPDPVAIRIGRIPDTAPPYDGPATSQPSGERGLGRNEPPRERGLGRNEPPGERGVGGGEPSRDSRTATASRPRRGAGQSPGGPAGTGPGRRVAARSRSGAGQSPGREQRGGPRPPGARDGRGAPGGCGGVPQRGGAPQRGGDGWGPGGRGEAEWPSRFAQVLAETLAGSLPPGQMTLWKTELARTHIRKLGPLLMASQRPVVRRVVTSWPSPDVMEMSIVVGVAGQVRALAIRLELQGYRRAAPGRPARQARWVCTTVEAA